MRIPKTLILLAFLPLLAAPAAGQFTSMKGDWWLKVIGDKGAMLLTFTEEQGSRFEVTGGGFSTAFETFYTISDDDTQELVFDFAGNITGTIELEDFSNLDPLGTLEITSGKVDEFFEFIRLKGLLTLSGGAPRKITIKGERLPTVPPAWTGRTHRGRLSGKDVKSKKYDLALMVLPTLGFPFYLLTGEGSALIDGEPRMDVQIGGVVLATPQGKLYGEFLFDGSTGIVRGRVRLKEGEDPRLVLKGRTFLDMRRVRIVGTLDIPITLPPIP